jgi:hypothetical protein
MVIRLFQNQEKQAMVILSKIRIFDILWWSYLKAEKLREEREINWNTIRY